MRFDLAAMARRKGFKKSMAVFRPIITTQAQADSLYAIYRQMLEPWSRAAQILGEQYQRELDRVLQHDTAEDLGATNDAIAQAINRLILELTPELRRWAVRTEQWHRGKWVRAVLAGVEVDLETIIGPEDVRETIDAWLVRNTSLIRDVNEQARGKVADAILRGYQQRAPAADVAKEIRAATDFARARSRRIAAHQTVSLSAQLDAERQRQAGIEIIKYHHSGKKHPREEHKARDGNLYELDTWREVKFEGGKKVYAGETVEPGDRAGQPPGCGCVTSAVLTFEGVPI